MADSALQVRTAIRYQHRRPAHLVSENCPALLRRCVGLGAPTICLPSEVGPAVYVSGPDFTGCGITRCRVGPGFSPDTYFSKNSWPSSPEVRFSLRASAETQGNHYLRA